MKFGCTACCCWCLQVRLESEKNEAFSGKYAWDSFLVGGGWRRGCRDAREKQLELVCSKIAYISYEVEVCRTGIVLCRGCLLSHAVIEIGAKVRSDTDGQCWHLLTHGENDGRPTPAVHTQHTQRGAPLTRIDLKRSPSRLGSLRFSGIATGAIASFCPVIQLVHRKRQTISLRGEGRQIRAQGIQPPVGKFSCCQCRHSSRGGCPNGRSRRLCCPPLRDAQDSECTADDRRNWRDTGDGGHGDT